MILVTYAVKISVKISVISLGVPAWIATQTASRNQVWWLKKSTNTHYVHNEFLNFDKIGNTKVETTDFLKSSDILPILYWGRLAFKEPCFLFCRRRLRVPDQSSTLIPCATVTLDFNCNQLFVPFWLVFQNQSFWF